MTLTRTAPKLDCNLFSVWAVMQRGLIVQFGQSCCWIKDSSYQGKQWKKEDSLIRCAGGTCKTEMRVDDEEPLVEAQKLKKEDETRQMKLWLERLGHLSKIQLIYTVKRSLWCWPNRNRQIGFLWRLCGRQDELQTLQVHWKSKVNQEAAADA